MNKFAILAASTAILICGIGSTSAATVKYTFEGYCDGLTLKEARGAATGTHTGKSCGGKEDDYAGGFSAKKVLGAVDTEWIITTADTELPAGTIEVIILDQTAMTWTIYEEVSNTTAFAFVNSGTLVDGAPSDAAPRAQTLQSAGAPPVK